jgi:hypothetical protein
MTTEMKNEIEVAITAATGVNIGDIQPEFFVGERGGTFLTMGSHKDSVTPKFSTLVMNDAKEVRRLGEHGCN